MTKLNLLFSFLLLSVTSSAWADGGCRGVDLRRPSLNRPQSQMFTTALGQISDSGQCANFSSALLVSQRLGVSLNAVDFAFQNNLQIVGRTRKSPGFCRQENVDAVLGNSERPFIQAFSDYASRVSGGFPSHLIEMEPDQLSQVGQWLDHVCRERIQEPPLHWTTIDLGPGTTAAQMGERIDQLLDAGHFVSYTHAFHAVTIVGRTEDCRYLIQDSIPEEAWDTFGGLKVSLSSPEDQNHISFKSQFFQSWPRATLLKNAVRIEYVESSDRPGN